jgi:hypothetical protein
MNRKNFIKKMNSNKHKLRHACLLFDLEVKHQGPTKVITVHDTLPYGHAPTSQI